MLPLAHRRPVRAVLAIAIGAAVLGHAPAAAAGTNSAPVLAFHSDRDGDSDIYIRLADGRLRQLTRNSALDFNPVWSPDGRWIAFVSDRDGDEDVYAMRPDGTQVRRLTTNSTRPDGQPIADFAPAWSPDGRAIAFASTRSGGLPEIWVMRADGTQPRRLTTTADFVDDTTPAWSPDGRFLVFASSRAGNETIDLYVMRRDGSGVRPVTPTDDGFDSTVPEWSPDGRRIAYSTNVTRGQQDIWVVDPRGERPRFLGGHPRYDDVAPHWSSHGRAIAYWTFPYDTPDESRSGDVWVMDADGSDRRAVVTAPSEDAAPDPRPTRTGC